MNPKGHYGMFTLEALTPRMEVPPNHVSVVEAARILGIPASSMHHYVQRRLIPSVRVSTPPKTTGLPYRYFVNRSDVEKFRTYVRVPLPGEWDTREAAREAGISPDTLKKWVRDGKVKPDRVVRTGQRRWFFWKTETIDELSKRMMWPIRGDEVFIDEVCTILNVNKQLALRLVQERVLHARKVREGSTQRLVFMASEVESLKAWYLKTIASRPGWRLFLKAKTRKDSHKYRALRRYRQPREVVQG